MMKFFNKIAVCISIALILCSVLTACTAPANNSIVGTWEYSNHTELKEYLTDVFDDSYFYKVYYQFDEDGSGRTWLETSSEYKAEFTYTFDGKTLSVKLQNGQTENLDCTFNGDVFYVSDGEETIKFEKID